MSIDTLAPEKIHHTHLLGMLTLQDQMNTRVHPDWRAQQFAWYRAIWTECAELMDHYGWKWWKKQTPDLEQIRLEVVDIWHFGLSIWLLEGGDTATLATQMLADWQNSPSDRDPREVIEALALDTLQHQRLHLGLFCELLALSSMTLDDLYRRYVGKNVLNFFRQDHGYKEGSYQKVWYGREDNEVLSDLLTQLDDTAHDFPDQLYQALAEAYPG